MKVPRPEVALVTCADLPHLDDDSAVLVPALESLGVQSRIVAWDDPAVDWAVFRLCVVRSTWDYAPRRDAYVAWAHAVGRVSRLWNPPHIVAWNTDKDYLREIEAWGFRTIPTLWLGAGTACAMEGAFERLGARTLVVKPRVSASGFDTHRVSLDDVAEAQEIVDGLLPGRDLMVQPYLSRIETDGESSLIFLGGAYSHTVRKVPRPGEFRSQEEWGSEITAVEPQADELAYATSLLERVEAPLAYGRVDLVRDDQDRPCLAELELTEPALYMKFCEGSEMRLARHIRDAL